MLIQITNKTKKNIHVCYIINESEPEILEIERKKVWQKVRQKKRQRKSIFFADSNLCHFPRSAKKVPANICLPKNLLYRRNTNTRRRILEQLQNEGHFWSDVIQWLDGSVVRQSFSRIKERVVYIFKWLDGSVARQSLSLSSHRASWIIYLQKRLTNRRANLICIASKVALYSVV